MLIEQELKTEEKIIAEKIKSIPQGTNGEIPVLDGIIDIEKYLNPKTKYKILWVLKEANYGKDPQKNYWDMLDFYRTATEVKIKESPTTKRVLLASHRILSDLSPIEAFRSIAYININKIAGYEKSNDRKIQTAYNKNKCLLLKQIKTYKPDIIICGNTLHYFENELNFRQGESRSIGMKQRNYFCMQDRLYINAYHPAEWRRINDKKYCDKIFEAFSFWKKEYKSNVLRELPAGAH